MAANCLPYEPHQRLRLREAIQDWLPEGHLAHFVSDTVDMLDPGAFHARYEKDGPRRSMRPMMVKVLLYAVRHGGVQLAQDRQEAARGRGVHSAGGAYNFPAHRTIRDFRAFHLKELSELFVQVVRLAREMRLKLGTIAWTAPGSTAARPPHARASRP